MAQCTEKYCGSQFTFAPTNIPRSQFFSESMPEFWDFENSIKGANELANGDPVKLNEAQLKHDAQISRLTVGLVALTKSYFQRCTLPRLEVRAPTSKKRNTAGPAPKKGAPGMDSLGFIQQVPTFIEAQGF
ncbi:hypothetical protein DFQ29_002576 [Apophysomyces sp. BC1021]|nr:hypothetical protein DFQ29_002576 [Apophysomyces sp. BC1021]